MKEFPLKCALCKIYIYIHNISLMKRGALFFGWGLRRLPILLSSLSTLDRIQTLVSYFMIYLFKLNSLNPTTIRWKQSKAKCLKFVTNLTWSLVRIIKPRLRVTFICLMSSLRWLIWVVESTSMISLIGFYHVLFHLFGLGRIVLRVELGFLLFVATKIAMTLLGYSLVFLNSNMFLLCLK